MPWSLAPQLARPFWAFFFPSGIRFIWLFYVFLFVQLYCISMSAVALLHAILLFTRSRDYFVGPSTHSYKTATYSTYLVTDSMHIQD